MKVWQRKTRVLFTCLFTHRRILQAFNPPPPPPADRCTSLMFIWETRLDFISYWWLFQYIPCCFLLQYFECFVLFYFENLYLSILKKVVHRQYPILIISVSGCNYPWVFSPVLIWYRYSGFFICWYREQTWCQSEIKLTNQISKLDFLLLWVWTFPLCIRQH